MNKPKPLLASEWEVLREQLKSEKNVMKALQEHYDEALKGVDTRIAELLGRGDANLPHVIRRVEYQKMIRAQITAALELLHAKEYETISEYLNECYTDAFVGSVYTLHAQDMPVIVPIDQRAAVKAVTIDSKLKSDLYSSLGVDITELKKTIAAEITRGIASGMLYSDMVRNIANAGKAPLSRARTIVRTEAGRVQEQATFDAAKGAKAVGANVVKQWSAILDGKTRDNHRRLDGQIREIDEPFEIDGHKAMHPHDFGRPEEDINCRCTMLTRARAALDESELKRLREKAVRHSLYMDDPKAFRADKLPSLKNFTEFKKAYLKIPQTVENTGESGIINAPKNKGSEDVHVVGRINRAFFKAITADATTDQVIITEERIAHSNLHSDAYTKYGSFVSSVLADPDFAFRDKKPNTAVLIKRVKQDGKNLELVLRIHVSTDNPEYKNSIISFWDISETRRKNYERNKEIIYKKE